MHEAATSKLVSEQARHDGACVGLAAAEQEFARALLEKSLVAALHQAEDHLASLASERPTKTAEEAEEKLRRIDAEIERAVEEVRRGAHFYAEALHGLAKPVPSLESGAKVGGR